MIDLNQIRRFRSDQGDVSKDKLQDYLYKNNVLSKQRLSIVKKLIKSTAKGDVNIREFLVSSKYRKLRNIVLNKLNIDSVREQ